METAKRPNRFLPAGFVWKPKFPNKSILKRRRFFAVLAFVVVFPCFLAAQDSGSTHVVKVNGEFLLSQTITFPPVPNMLYYKTEIERLVGETFVPVDILQTETNSVEVALKAGSYRYRILAYNRMNLLDGVSDWQEFQVLVAIEPVAETYQPLYGLYYEMANPSGSITVRGRDFFPESEFALVKQDTKFDWSGVDLDGREDVIFPDRVTVAGDRAAAVLEFSIGKLEKGGDYYIFVRNPGGLWAVMGRVRVGFRKNSDWTLSFGWSPMIAGFDPGSDTYWDYDTNNSEPVLDVFNSRGGYIRLGWFPVKTRIGNFGLELNWLFLADNYWVSRHGDPWPGEYFGTIHGGHVDIVYQKPFTSWKNWQLEIRAGVGSSNPFDDMFVYYDSERTIPFPLLLNFGFSVQYFIWKNLYAEAGLDFQYMTEVDHFMLRPALGLGWQFGRWAEVVTVDRALKRGEDPSVPVTNIPKDEITLSVGWSPMIPLFDYSYTTTWWNGFYYGEHVEPGDLEPFNPLGIYLRIACLPHRWGDNKFGYESALYILDHPNRETYSPPYNYIDILRYGQFGVLYQRKLPKDWQLNARLGVGISNPYDFNSMDVEIPLAMNAGLSVQRFFWRDLYAEAGFDMVVSFGRKTHWILNPGIGIGWQFNRDAETGLRLK
jgi:hypothetical protein